jgi:hypothetical protein
MTCTFTVTLVDSQTNAPVTAAAMTATWANLPSTTTVNGWPYTVTAPTRVSGNTYSFTAKTLSATTNTGCKLTLNTVTKSGFVLDSTAVLSFSRTVW